jgi:predicted nucleotidyltransferase
MVKRAIPRKIEKDIKEYVGVLKRSNLPITKVILFGSYAKGTPTRWSDIDLCIVSPKFKDSFLAMQYLWLKKVKDSFPAIEPVGYSPKDFEEGSSLIQEIKKSGVEVKV